MSGTHRETATVIHGSTILLGALLACYGVPRTVLIPVGGTLADKISPRTTMLVADASRFVFVAVFALFTTHHDVSIVALGPLAALIGAGEGVFLPASRSILPSLLDEGMLLSGNAYFGAGQQFGSLLGPAVGGALVAGFGPVPALAVDAASFGVSALSIALIRARAAGPGADKAAAEAATDADAAEPAGPSPGIRRVFRLLRESRPLQVIFMVSLAANLALAGLGEVALPALVHDRWAASGYGAVLTCLAAGGLLGSLVAARAGGLRRPMVAAGLALIVMSGAVALVPFLGGIVGAAAAILVVGLSTSFTNTISTPSLQTAVPPELLGRTMSVLMLCAFGSQPISVAVTGVLIRHIGPAAFFPITGAFVGVVALLGLAQREWRDFGARDGSIAGEPPALEPGRPARTLKAPVEGP